MGNHRNDRGAAEMVGVLMLIALFVVVIAVFAVTWFSNPPPEKSPAVNMQITNETRVIKINHAGGDPLYTDRLQIYVDGTLRTFEGFGNDNIWMTGETIQFTVPDTDPVPVKVDVVYSDSPMRGTRSALIAQLLLGNLTTVRPEGVYHTINAAAGIGGSISPSGSYYATDGASVTFTITNSSTYEIDVLTDNGVAQSVTDVTPTVHTYTLSAIHTDHTILVTFKPLSGSGITHTITASYSAGGTLVPSGIVTVPDGGSQTFNANPDASYMIQSVLVNGTPVVPVPTSYTFTNVIKDHTIAASFTPAYLPGIIGTYHKDRQLSWPTATRVHSRINFADAEGVLAGYGSDVNDWPNDYITQVNNFSISYDGFLKIDAAGTYRFYMRGCDGYSLELNSVKIIDRWGNPVTATAGATCNSEVASSPVALTAGYYPISIKMWDNTGTSQIRVDYRNATTLTQRIISNYNYTALDIPPVDFVGSPLSGTAPHTVQFTDYSYGATTWNWDFGDNSSHSYEQNPVHIYTNPGQYTVSLTAANTYGYDTKTKINYITVGSESSCIAGLAGTYYANSTWTDPGKTRTDARIAFADGWYPTDYSDETDWPVGSGFLPSEEYFSVIWDGYMRVNTSDTYTFRLTSDDGSYLYVDDNLLIDNGGLHAEFVKTGSTTLTPGWHHIVIRYYEYTQRALAYLEFHPSNTSVYHYVSDVCHIEYTPAPVASFTATPVSGYVPMTVSFTDTSTGTPTSWLWNFGDGNTTGNTLQNPTHLYTAQGTYPVSLTATNTGGSSTSPAQNIVVSLAAPTVTSVTPAVGPASGGTVVSIIGTNFTATSTVAFGGTPATNVTFKSATWITANSPVHAVGTIHVTVTNAVGTSATSSADQFTYQAPPTVTAISPTHGPVEGGTSVTITGTNFNGATVVMFGTNAASFTVNGPTQITATSPVGIGIVHVTVTTPSGTSPATLADMYSYYTILPFTSSGSWTVPDNVTTAQYLIIAGGGGGGSYGGGGGAGGFRTGSMGVTPGHTWTVTVGDGGDGGNNGRGSNGANSQIRRGGTTIRANSGGGGGSYDGTGGGRDGGSGGGAADGSPGQENANPDQGNDGGDGYEYWQSSNWRVLGGGGGGAGAVGGDAASGQAGDGGTGTTSSITDVLTTYAGGGGGGGYSGTAGSGGTGGGGAGAVGNNDGADASYYGGGGGGGGSNGDGGNGYQGIVIIRYS